MTAASNVTARLDAALKMAHSLRGLAMSARELRERVTCGNGVECAFVSDLALDIDRALYLVRNLKTLRGLDSDIAYGIEQELARDRDNARDLTIDADFNLSTALGLACRLEHVAALLDGRISQLEGATGDSAQPAVAEPDESHFAVPPRCVVRLTAIAVRVLPPAHRPRYREEFEGELNELATHGCTSREQLRHVAGLLRSVCALRWELRDRGPARRWAE